LKLAVETSYPIGESNIQHPISKEVFSGN